MALELKSSGDTKAALQLLQSLPDNTDAKNQISEITLSEAKDAETEGGPAKSE